MKSKETFKKYLLKEGRAKATATTYFTTLKVFEEKGYKYTFESICSWKEWLIDNYKTSTVNLRIQSMNEFLKFNNFDFTIKTIKVQPQQFVNNELTISQYNKLLKNLLIDELYEWWVVVKILATTGLRISEFLQITRQDIINGYIDVLGKGSKSRRVWFPKKLQKDVLKIWVQDKFIVKCSDSYIRAKFLKFAKDYNIPKEIMHPHEFRSFYARNVYNKTKDLRLLQNLLGYSNVATTMLYLRKTSVSIGNKISDIVDW